MKILGLSFFYHDSAAALIVDGSVVAAVQEERFTRIKHDKSLPKNAVKYCLESQDIKIEDIDYVVFYDKPILKFDRLLQTYIKTWPKGLLSFLRGMEATFTNTLSVEKKIRKNLKYKGEILYTEHHYSHASSSYYTSNFNDSVIVTMDGVGEWDTTTIGYAKDNDLKLTHSIVFPDSLGLLYSALTYYLGFKVNSAEYKVMGLAPYGDPEKYYNKIMQLIDIKEDGSFKLDMKYFAYEYGLTMTNKNFDELFGAPTRKSESELTQREKDIASSLQKVTEEIILKIVKYAKSLSSSENLCLAGGVALNCVANGLILKQNIFKNIYIQPASGDAGGAIGSALYVYYNILKNKKKDNVMPNPYLGPEYSNKEINKFLTEKALEKYGSIKFDYCESEDHLVEKVASLINGNNVIGLFEGKMEFGPRALGNRSIIADARVKENWQKVNLKIKFRESFRPFAPTVLEDQAYEYFDLNVSSPYMLLVAQTKKNIVPAITHVDGSARIQTVSKEQNLLYYKIINQFYKNSGCAVIINTSFNVRGEPIVESPENAFNCFVNTEMDYLVMGNFIISKKDNDLLSKYSEKEKYLEKFELD